MCFKRKQPDGNFIDLYEMFSEIMPVYIQEQQN
jgi:hypothetical protein